MNDNELADAVLSIISQYEPVREDEILQIFKETYSRREARRVRDLLNQETNSREGRIGTVIETRYILRSTSLT